HRGLLRFNSADEVAFERVFSWLDVNLVTTNFAGTIATNLTAVGDFLNYPIAYSNYLAASIIYSNYLAARARGVNGDWNLYVKDTSGNAGSNVSWGLVVETAATGIGSLSTNEFTNTTGITIQNGGNATPYPSTITVSGVSDAVTTIRVKINGLSHSSPRGLEIRLAGPRGNDCYLMQRVGGGNPGAVNVNLVFSDSAV